MPAKEAEFHLIPIQENPARSKQVLSLSSVQSTLTNAEILTLCRRASIIHFEMILTPSLLVQNRIRPDLQRFYDHRGRSWKTRFVMLILASFVVALPWIYANTVMANPCKPEDMKIGPPDGHMKAMEVRKRGCEVEMTLMQHPLKMGGLLIASSLVLAITLSLMTNLLYCLYYQCGKPDSILNLKRLMWRPLLLFWHYRINLKVKRLKYTNAFHTFPPLYTPPSVVICWVYFVLIMEMLVIGIRTGHMTFGIVLAYAMGELLLTICDVLVSTGEDVELVTHGEIKGWLPEGWSVGTATIFDRLEEVSRAGKTEVHISSKELASLQELDRKLIHDAPSDRREGDDSLDGVGVITKVYVVDANLIVDLVTGDISSVIREASRSMSASST